MRVVIQRVSTASVTVDGQMTASIGPGFLILLGIEAADTEADAEWLCRKISLLRVFEDENGLMNRSIQDTGGQALVVSQFTLHAAYRKGNRPSFTRAARPEKAIPLYDFFTEKLSELLGKPVGRGQFGSDMKIALTNEGPVTILMDSQNPE